MNELNFERKMATIFKKRILISAIMSVMVLTAIADEYTDPQTNVVYTYEPGQSTASVKAGYEEVINLGELMEITHPGSPDAAGDVVILDKFTVGTAEYVVTSIGKWAFVRNRNIKSVIIPETVTDIGPAAFEYCDSLTAVQLPDGLTQIAYDLFYCCCQLVSVDIPFSVCSIGDRAFAECSSLTNLSLPANLTFIGKFPFNNTPWYTALYNETPDGPFYIGPQLAGYKGDAPTGELIIKEGTTCIGYQAFNYCTGLTSVTIPKSLAHVEYEAFHNCVGLTAVHITDLAAWCNIEFKEEFRSSSNPLFNAHHLYLNGEEVTDLVIPDGVTSIGRYAFDNCTGLTNVIIPDGVTRIGTEAFRSCSNLTSITIPPSVTTIESNAFLWSKNLNAVHISDLAAWCGISFNFSSNPLYNGAHFYLKGEEVNDLVIPEGVAGIGNGAFMNCSYLTSVTIPESVNIIGEYAFNNCSEITSISLPTNLSSIGYSAFAHCSGLTNISIPEGITSISEFTFNDCSGLTSIVIPESVTRIGHGAFAECNSLTTITIPNKVTFIDNFAFSYCKNLTDVYCHADDVPSTGERIFYDTPIATATLHVPAGSIDLYKTTSPWSEFGNIVAIMPIEINETTFPDEYFRNWILAKDYGKDGVLTEEEIAGVEKILISKNGIHSLKGIEYFTELKSLYCSAIQLKELDVSKCTKLEVLECDWNQLTSLDVSKNNALKELICGANPLTKLDVSHNYSLNELHCFQNKLTELDVSKNIELTYLNCHDNQLTAIDLSENTALERLWCAQNLLTSLNMFGHAKLKSIRCEGNKLTTLNVSDCPSLYEVFCYNNQICGEAMDVFVESLPISPRKWGYLMVADTVNEQNVMTKTQVAAAKAKDWSPRYINGANGLFSYTEYEGVDDLVTFTQGQMATIILPTEPDASKGKYYRLDKCEDGQIIFEQELQPQARVPYIIIPNEDFSIDPSTMDLEGLSHDAVSIEGISFIGSYSHEEFSYQEGFYIDIIDTTPDCLDDWFGSGKAIVGPLRAYLQVNWDDPYTQGGTKDPQKIKEIVLHNHGTGLVSPLGETEEGVIFDLQGRRIDNSKFKIQNSKLSKGVYIFNGKKVLR